MRLTSFPTKLIITKQCSGVQDLQGDGWGGKRHPDVQRNPGSTGSRSQSNVRPCKLKQEELREVFDGSCDLIPVGLIAKECKALVEQFVPELVETLASEMNPDT